MKRSLILVALVALMIVPSKAQDFTISGTFPTYPIANGIWGHYVQIRLQTSATKFATNVTVNSNGSFSYLMSNANNWIPYGTYVTVQTTGCKGGPYFFVDSFEVKQGITQYTVNPDPCPGFFASFYRTQTTSGGNPVPFSATIYNISVGSGLSFLWDFGDGTTSTLSNPTHTYSTNGPYYLTLTASQGSNTDVFADTIRMDANGNFHRSQQGFTINVKYGVPVGIEKPEVDQKIRFFPIPTQGNLTVELGISTKGSVQLFSLEGKLVYEQNFQNESKLELELNAMPRGIYLLQVLSEGNSYREKVVLE